MSASSRFSKNKNPVTGRGNRLEGVNESRYRDLGADWDAIDPGFIDRFQRYAENFDKKVRERLAESAAARNASV